tara:strand:- start:166 stop:390 length:225 start_codon:yes stop_codon:yes gene_type:complete
MGSLERKLARKQNKKMKKMEKRLTKKLNMFSSLPDNCLVCNKDFDKKSKEHATSWFVNVYGDEVQLYCPSCWKE